MTLQQFLWRQRQDSGFLDPEKSRTFTDVDVAKCGERAAALARMGGVRITLGNDFGMKD